MAEFSNDDHPYPFMLYQQNSTVMETPPPSASRNLYLGESPLGWSNHVHDLASHLGGLSMSNPNNIYTGTAGRSLYSGLRNQGTNRNNVDEAALYRTRIAMAAHAAARNRVHGLYDDRAVPYQYTEPMRGRLVREAKDPCGCRLLRRKIDEGTFDEINVIIIDLKDNLHDLMKHPFGNYVILKFFQTTNCSMAQVNYVLSLITYDVRLLKDVCTDEQGNRVIQKIMENLNTPNLLYIFISAIRRIVVALMKNINGGFVVQHCMKLFPPLYKKVILDEAARNCLDIARDRCGCCVIQKCLNLAAGEDATMHLVSQIISNVGILAEDPYGNYVVQFLAKLKLDSVNSTIISQLCGKFVRLSMNKYASNVVEDLLHYSETNDVAVIVLELMQSSEFLNVLQDPYGNFVAQKAVLYSKLQGPLHNRLCDTFLSMSDDLHSHIYGKRVLMFTKLHRAYV